MLNLKNIYSLIWILAGYALDEEMEEVNELFSFKLSIIDKKFEKIRAGVDTLNEILQNERRLSGKDKNIALKKRAQDDEDD